MKTSVLALLFACIQLPLHADKLPKDFVAIPATNGIAAFYMAKFPVTNAQYAKFLAENPDIRPPQYWKNGTFPKGKAKHPVVYISYYDAKAYCEWMTAKTPGFSFRLPTMEEWEYAAGGKEGYQAYPWGDNKMDDCFNYNAHVARVYLKQNPIVTYVHERSSQKGQKMRLSDVIQIQPNGSISGWNNHRDHTGFVYTDLYKKLMEEGGYTTPVDAYPKGKSSFGIFDMSGNTWDWTSSTITATNGAERGLEVQAVKGGSWYAMSRSCRIDMRGEGRRPGVGYHTIGFRLVADKK